MSDYMQSPVHQQMSARIVPLLMETVSHEDPLITTPSTLNVQLEKIDSSMTQIQKDNPSIESINVPSNIQIEAPRNVRVMKVEVPVASAPIPSNIPSEASNSIPVPSVILPAAPVVGSTSLALPKGEQPLVDPVSIPIPKIAPPMASASIAVDIPTDTGMSNPVPKVELPDASLSSQLVIPVEAPESNFITNVSVESIPYLQAKGPSRRVDSPEDPVPVPLETPDPNILTKIEPVMIPMSPLLPQNVPATPAPNPIPQQAVTTTSTTLSALPVNPSTTTSPFPPPLPSSTVAPASVSSQAFLLPKITTVSTKLSLASEESTKLKRILLDKKFNNYLLTGGRNEYMSNEKSVEMIGKLYHLFQINKIYCFYMLNFSGSSSGCLLTPTTLPPLPIAIYDHMAIFVDNSILVCGGHTRSDNIIKYHWFT